MCVSQGNSVAVNGCFTTEGGVDMCGGDAEVKVGRREEEKDLLERHPGIEERNILSILTRELALLRGIGAPEAAAFPMCHTLSCLATLSLVALVHLLAEPHPADHATCC